MTTSDRESTNGAEHVRAERTSGGLYDVEFLVDGEAIARADNVAFVCTAGSRLYGTAGDDSDVDLKGVWVEPLDSIILGEDDDERRYRTAEDRGGEGTPSGAEDVDVALLELRTFVCRVLEGHPAAVEMLYIPESLRHVESDLWRELLEGRNRLVSAELAGFVDYCKSKRREFTGEHPQADSDVDRKGLYHAWRVAWELRELRATGKLDLPIVCADYLRRLRNGEVPLDEARTDLAELVEGALDTPSDLPDQPDREFWRNWLVDHYRGR